MDFDAIRRTACGKPPLKKAPPTVTKPSKPPPPANPTPAPPPPGPSQGPGFPPHMGHHFPGEFENFPGDPPFGFMEHSRSWKLGFHPNYPDNYSHQHYQGQIPVPQEYSESCYGNPRMNSKENYRQVGIYPDYSMGTLNHPDDSHYNCQSNPGYITTLHGRRGISGPPPRLALPPPDRYMDDHHDPDHHHGYGQLSHRPSYGGNHRAPRIREFGPGAYGPPPLLGPPPYDPYHFPGGQSGAQYYLPTYGNCFSDENPNACSVM